MTAKRPLCGFVFVAALVGLLLPVGAAADEGADDSQLALKLGVQGGAFLWHAYSIIPFPQAALTAAWEPLPSLLVSGRASLAPSPVYSYGLIEAGVGFAPRLFVLQPYLSAGLSGGGMYYQVNCDAICRGVLPLGGGYAEGGLLLFPDALISVNAYARGQLLWVPFNTPFIFSGVGAGLAVDVEKMWRMAS